MKKILLVFIMLCANTFAQDKYMTKTGVLNFEASVPSFEEVAASNKSTTAILNTENGEFAALAFVKAFKFKNALMEEHFNENYAESSEYPKAYYKGTIHDFSLTEIENKKEFVISGQLTFHGVTKAIENLNISLQYENGLIKMSGEFITLSSDYNIKIPKIVQNKLSDEVTVSFEFLLEKK